MCNLLLHPTLVATAVFAIGTGLLMLGQAAWLKRIDAHPLLRSEDKLQNKDSLVIATFFVVLLLLALCIAGAGAALLFTVKGAAQLTLMWALACCAVGAAFGFLLGHPRRLAEDKVGKDERTGTSWLLRTGLDDMVDWLVKGLTTVLLVQATTIIAHVTSLSAVFGAGLETPPLLPVIVSSTATAKAIAFAQPVIVFFTLFGTLAACLVTRTYLTGALGRADRSTVGAFTTAGLSFSETLLLLRHQRSLGSRGQGPLSPELARVATKLAGLALDDLGRPQEFALWAKAKSFLGEPKEALSGYEKAVALCECDPILALDYAVALHAAGQIDAARLQLEEAHRHLSTATDPDTRKNIYKSLTYSLLYLNPPQSFERTLKLVGEFDDYLKRGLVPPSGSLRVNEVCAWGQKFKWQAQLLGLLKSEAGQPFLVDVPAKNLSAWPAELMTSFKNSLRAMEQVLSFDRAWISRFLMLLSRNDVRKRPGSEEFTLDDLEVFERFDEFRLPLGLPPWSSSSVDENGQIQDQPQAGNRVQQPPVTPCNPVEEPPPLSPESQKDVEVEKTSVAVKQEDGQLSGGAEITQPTTRQETPDEIEDSPQSLEQK